MTESRGEREIVMAAQHGDANSFRLLYERNVDAIFRYAAARVGAQDAEDITAETFARAWRSLASYEDRGRPFVAWLYRIALNEIRSRSRRNATAAAKTPTPVEVRGEFEDDLVNALSADSVREAFRSLSERQRLVLELRIVRALPVAEVAELLGTTDEATRALTHRALSALRSHRLIERSHTT